MGLWGSEVQILSPRPVKAVLPYWGTAFSMFGHSLVRLYREGERPLASEEPGLILCATLSWVATAAATARDALDAAHGGKLALAFQGRERIHHARTLTPLTAPGRGWG